MLIIRIINIDININGHGCFELEYPAPEAALGVQKIGGIAIPNNCQIRKHTAFLTISTVPTTPLERFFCSACLYMSVCLIRGFHWQLA